MRDTQPSCPSADSGSSTAACFCVKFKEVNGTIFFCVGINIYHYLRHDAGDRELARLVDEETGRSRLAHKEFPIQ